MRTIVPAILLCSTLLACDTENSAKLRLAENLGEFAFDDQFGSTVSQDSLIVVQSTMAGTSSDGGTVDLQLTYTLDPFIQSALTPSAYIQFEYVVPDQPAILVSRETITDELTGELQISVPTDDADAQLIATVGGLLPNTIDNQGILVARVPAVAQRELTDLSLVQELSAELVDGSYQTNVVDGRRLHEFALRVTDPTAGPISNLVGNVDDFVAFDYSITGLETNVAAHFTALENGIEDIESPVKVSFAEHPLAVYLVIDASKSVVESRQSHNLLNAVSSTVIALSKNAQFDYRVFNGGVRRIQDLRSLDFDSGDSSATALYYALDTALADIESSGSIEQDKIVLVFTDGIDLASRNHYRGEFIDNDQVHEYIVQRVDQVKRTQSSVLGRQLDVYTVGFYDETGGIDVSQEVTKLDAIARAGGTSASYNNFNAADIDSAFAAIVHNVKGVYYLQYSSQQTADNNAIELVVSVNGRKATVTLPAQ